MNYLKSASVLSYRSGVVVSEENSTSYTLYSENVYTTLDCPQLSIRRWAHLQHVTKTKTDSEDNKWHLNSVWSKRARKMNIACLHCSGILQSFTPLSPALDKIAWHVWQFICSAYMLVFYNVCCRQRRAWSISLTVNRPDSRSVSSSCCTLFTLE